MDSKPPSRVTRRQFVTTSAAVVATGSLSDRFTSALAAPATEQEPAGQTTGRGPFRAIIDTDPGVDDALALLLAMRSPELKIEGITPVAGNVPLDLALPNALRMVEIAGRTDIPVAAGAKVPLVRRLVTAAYAHGENGLGGAVFPEPKTTPVTQPAAEFIRGIVRKYPGEVTLIPIGPLTNIATALNLDAELAAMVRGIVLMGGSLSGKTSCRSEFNIYVDPRPAFFQSGAPYMVAPMPPVKHPLPRTRASCGGAELVSQWSANRPQCHQPQPRAGFFSRSEYARLARRRRISRPLYP
jgi:purine nucleosidase